jgi:tetratricopeptide (TPR) repeat protein
MEMEKTKTDWLSPLWLGIYVFTAAFVVFYTALQGSFLNWDDEYNFINNTAWRGLSATNIKWMFTTLYSTHYTPLTWLTLGFDYKLWGMNAFGYHLTSLVFHGGAAVMLFLLLRELFALALPQAQKKELDFAALFGALFFAVHPLRVESVAWITERRDVTGGFFALLCAWLYAKAARDTAHSKGLRTGALLSFAAAILSRESEAALAPSLLLLDWYPLGRLGTSPREWFSKERLGVWLEKIPYFALALFGSFIAVTANSDGHINAVNHLAFAQRAAQFIAGFAFYLMKTVWPFGLSPAYAAPGFGMSEAMLPLAFLAVLAVVVAFFARRRAVWLALGVYALFILPTLGVVFTTSYAYDRFSYMSCIGFAGLFGGAVYLLSCRFAKAAYASALCAVLALAGLSARQSMFWGDSLTLWEHAVQIAPGSITYEKRGEAYSAIMHYDLARQDFKTALSFYPDDAELLAKLGVLELKEADFAAALRYLQRAIALSPSDWNAHLALAKTLDSLGRYGDAAREFSFCAATTRDMHQRYISLSARGEVLLKTGGLKPALSALQAAAALEPSNPASYNNIATAYVSAGDTASALEYYVKTIALAPYYAPAYMGRAQLLRKLGRDAEASADDAVAQRLNPIAFAAAASHRQPVDNKK